MDEAHRLGAEIKRNASWVTIGYDSLVADIDALVTLATREAPAQQASAGVAPLTDEWLEVVFERHDSDFVLWGPAAQRAYRRRVAEAITAQAAPQQPGQSVGAPDLCSTKPASVEHNGCSASQTGDKLTQPGVSHGEVPAGFVLVPTEPTPEMLSIMNPHLTHTPYSRYKAMLTAARAAGKGG